MHHEKKYKSRMRLCPVMSLSIFLFLFTINDVLHTETEKSVTKGIYYLILSSLCFALMGVCVRKAGDVPFIQKTFFRNSIAFIIAFIILIKEYRDNRAVISLPRGAFTYLLLRALTGTIGLFGNFYALDKINIADAAILNKMAPFFTIIFSKFLLGEKIAAIPFAAICGALCGALFIIKPSFNFSAMVPSLIGFAGGIGAGFAYTCVRKLGTMRVSSSVIVAFFSAFSSLLALPFLIFSYCPMAAFQLLSLLAAGVAAAGGQFFVTMAYRLAPASKIGIFDYSQILFSSLLGYIAFAQVPDAMSFCGYVIIIAMAIVVFLYNKKHAEI